MLVYLGNLNMKNIHTGSQVLVAMQSTPNKPIQKLNMTFIVKDSQAVAKYKY